MASVCIVCRWLKRQKPDMTWAVLNQNCKLSLFTSLPLHCSGFLGGLRWDFLQNRVLTSFLKRSAGVFRFCMSRATSKKEFLLEQEVASSHSCFEAHNSTPSRYPTRGALLLFLLLLFIRTYSFFFLPSVCADWFIYLFFWVELLRRSGKKTSPNEF